MSAMIDTRKTQLLPETQVLLTTEVRTSRRRWRLPAVFHRLLRRLRRRPVRIGSFDIRFTTTGIETWTWRTCVHIDPISVEEIGSWVAEEDRERILEVRTV